MLPTVDRHPPSVGSLIAKALADAETADLDFPEVLAGACDHPPGYSLPQRPLMLLQQNQIVIPEIEVRLRLHVVRLDAP